ncbi:ATP-binding protein [Sandaracinus amylolyticus]|uniref:histidine kinase n=1 Tax=Sandaracinus amylolyticus TaxID=927083 RepID=A0A0F6W3J0_9BACT|nr:ATP-binding protein [Sandaracinus amylolyticus]AKF06383.1 Flagellar sensor histidine kinase FleS [Sandaracinus amylolyticus]
MSADAALRWTWCAIYGFAAVYYLALWARTHRRDPEHASYACICAGLAIHAAGAALLCDAATLSAGTLAVRLQYAGSIAASAFFVDFTSHLVERPRRRVVLAAYAVAALGLLLDVTGRLVDPARSTLHAPMATDLPRVAIEPSLRVEGIVVLVVSIAFGLVAVAALVRSARRDADARLVLVGVVITFAAGIHDMVVHGLGLGSQYVAEHAGLAPSIAVGIVLMRRFVRAARELEQRTDELARSYDELRQTQEELVRKEQLAAVGELSAVIAHEVRNPLAILKNAVSSLRRPTLTHVDRGVLLSILDEETDRLNRLVRDLLAYARPVAPKGSSVEVEPLVTRAFELACGGRREHTDVHLELELDGAPSAVLGDAELLRHAIVNVMDNALQAMGPRGRLRVEATPTALDARPAISLAFTDTGEGMDTLVRAKALDPFFTTRPAGTGLGLAIVDRVVKNHGGTLSIESAPGAGTTVTLTLPAVSA